MKRVDPKICKEALPCPWCGCAAFIEPWHGGGPGKRLISCGADYLDQPMCSVSPSVTGGSKATALRLWNTRSLCNAPNCRSWRKAAIARLDAYDAAARKFINKVESGQAKSKETYAELRAALTMQYTQPAPR